MKNMTLNRNIPRSLSTLTAIVAAGGLCVGAYGQNQNSGQQSSPDQQRQQQNQQRQSQQASQQNQQQQPSRHNQQRQSQAKPGQGYGMVTGRVQDVKVVNFNEDQSRHVLAKVRTENGSTVVVDLGTADDLRGQRIQRNQQVSVLGRSGRLNDKPILVAERVRGVDEQNRPTLTIVRAIPVVGAEARLASDRITPQQANRQTNRQANRRNARQGQQRMWQQQGRQAWQQRGQQNMTQATLIVGGKLVQTKQISIRGHDHQHVLAKVRDDQGRTFIADLGTPETLNRLNVSQGEFLAITGSMGRINGRPVLFASEVANVEQVARPQEDERLRSGGNIPFDGNQQRRQQGQNRQNRQSGQSGQSGQTR